MDHGFNVKVVTDWQEKFDKFVSPRRQFCLEKHELYKPQSHVTGGYLGLPFETDKY